MTIRQIWLAAAMTVAYLLVELAFNARLLDVVGAAVSVDELHRIEVFGRLLSSLAAALLVWQLLLGPYNRMVAAGSAGSARWMMVVATSVAAAGTYGMIQWTVNTVVGKTDAEFRRTSVFLALVQKSMVDGRVVIDGMAGGAEVFSRPEGKAFLGVFPIMAASVDDLESKVSDAIAQVVREQVASSLGGINAYHKAYREGAFKLKAKYEKEYSKMPTPAQLEVLARQKADEAWDEYVDDLAKRGWTPRKVPYFAQNRVAREVRAKIPIPRDWNTWEEEEFKRAVMSKARAETPTSARFNGRSIPAGLSWQAFFAHPAIQDELREKMKVPDGIMIQPSYEITGAVFRREIFNPVVASLAAQEIARFKAPLKTYEPGGSNHERGVMAARAVILPPMALGFSMLGAITHAGKLVVLVTLLVAAVLGPRGDALRRWAMAVGAATVVTAWLTLSLMTNPVASSRLYTFLQRQVMAEQPWYIGNALHVIAVGQSVLYPVNESIRQNVLRGFDFGYRGPK